MQYLDEEWFDRLRVINAQVPRRLTPGNYSEAKRRFFASNADSPEFTLPELFDTDVLDKIKAFVDLDKDINESTETPVVVKQLYRKKIVEKTQQLQLIDAIQSRNQNLSQSIADDLYGSPDQVVFDHLLSVLQRTLPAEVWQILGISKDYKNISSIIPDFPAINPVCEPGSLYETEEQVVEFVKSYLHKHDLECWKVEVNPRKVGGFLVRPLAKKIFVPSTKMLKKRQGERELNRRQLQAVLAHEIDTHVVRSENGSQAILRLLWDGLDNYLLGEEGLATMREQQILGGSDYCNQSVHLALGLAYGLDRNGEKRSFRSTHHIVSNFLINAKQQSRDVALNRAFNICTRMYKAVPGGGMIILPKVRVYREGNIAVRRLLQLKPELEKWFDIGKFDPSNQSHVSTLTELGLIGG